MLVAAAIGLVIGGVAVYFATGGTAAPAAGGPTAATAGDAGEAGQGGAADGPAQQQGPPPALVRVGRVEQQRLENRIELVGRLEQVRDAIVAAEVEGKVLDVPMEEGDLVVAGQTVLAEIDGVWARADLAAAEADVASAKATLDQSERDLAYLRELAEAGSAKPKEVDDAAAKVESDRAALEAARARLERAVARAARLKVVAPFDGVVVQKLVERGQWVSPGMGVAEVYSRGQIDAVVDVPEKWINQVALGDRVEVRIEPLSRLVSGRVIAVVPAGGNSARTFPVKIRLPNEDETLKPGMSVTALIAVGQERPRLTVPRDAVQVRPDGVVVWMAMEGEGPMPVAMPMPVRLWFGVEDRMVIEPIPGPGPALAEGTRVVIEGAERLFPTQPLNIEGEDGREGEAAGADGPDATPG